MHCQRTSIAAVLCAVVMTAMSASPASATDDLTRRSCEAMGGAFHRVAGTKTCVVVQVHVTRVKESTYHYVDGRELPLYRAEMRRITRSWTTTTLVQQGEGPVVSSSATTSDTWNKPLACLYWDYDRDDEYYFEVPVPIADCDALGMYASVSR